MTSGSMKLPPGTPPMTKSPGSRIRSGCAAFVISTIRWILSSVMKGDPACKSEKAAMRIPLRFAGQDCNVIRVSRRTSREGSITNAHKARIARQQSSAIRMILARERCFLFMVWSSELPGLHQFAPSRPRRQIFPGLLVEPLAFLWFEDRAFDYAVDRFRVEVVLIVEPMHPIEHLPRWKVREVGHRQLLPQLIGHF